MRVVVLSGNGKAFCAGADLAWMAKAVAYSQVENLADAEDFALMLERIDTLPMPVIGRVHGAALGGGVGLAAVCDIVVAAEDATFGLTEVKLGILPAVISPYVLRKIGVSAARELFLSGNRFSAVRARELGLVHELVPESELDAAIERRVADLLTSGPSAVAAAKALIRDVTSESPKDVIGSRLIYGPPAGTPGRPLRVLQHAVCRDQAGTFNVAGDGILTLSQAVRRLQRATVPLPGFAVGQLGSVLRQARLADFSPEQLSFLTFGRGIPLISCEARISR